MKVNILTIWSSLVSLNLFCPLLITTTGIHMCTSTFNLQGGIELGGIYVKTMAPEGPAALSGKINIGALRNQYLFFFKLLLLLKLLLLFLFRNGLINLVPRGFPLFNRRAPSILKGFSKSLGSEVEMLPCQSTTMRHLYNA